MRTLRLSLPILLIITYSCDLVAQQQKAITETGDEVILFDDGTWKYKNRDPESRPVAQLNPQVFSKAERATFLLKSKNVEMGFWLDPKKWTFSKSELNDDAEYDITAKSGDIYGIVITEGFEIELEALRSIALENALGAAPDAEIVFEEYRMVNGNKVLCLQINGSVQGVRFTYFGYYLSNPSGTTQYITITPQNKFMQYRADCEELLNGLVAL